MNGDKVAQHERLGSDRDSPPAGTERPFIVDLGDDAAGSRPSPAARPRHWPGPRPPASPHCPASCSPPRSRMPSTRCGRGHAPRGAGGLRAGRRRPSSRSWPAAPRSSRTRPSRRWPASSIRSSGSTASMRSSPRWRRCSDSGERAGAADQPIAVLVQPLIEPKFGGVMFGIDPVSGRTDRRVVTAVRGGPEPLVSGEVDGSRYVLERRRARCSSSKPTTARRCDGPTLRRLVALSDQVASVFGGPQDVEWAIATDGAAVAAAVAPGHHRGPRRAPGARLRSGAGRGDVPRAPHRAGARPLGPPASRGRRRGRAPGRGRHPGRVDASEVVVPSTGTSPSICGSRARSSPSAASLTS